MYCMYMPGHACTRIIYVHVPGHAWGTYKLGAVISVDWPINTLHNRSFPCCTLPRPCCVTNRKCSAIFTELVSQIGGEEDDLIGDGLTEGDEVVGEEIWEKPS